MLKELQDMGLSEKEARVYLAALELGQTTAEKLAKHAKVNRSTTYVQLESLMKMGLMSTHEEGKKTMFAPESPELLKRLLLKQRDEVSMKESHLVELLPALLQQYEGAGERPVVRFFPGKEGIATVREEVLSTKDKQLYVIMSSDNMSKLFTEKELDGYTARRTALNISSKAIYTHRGYFDQAGADALTEHRFLPNLPLTIDIRIFDDKTALFSLQGALFAMVIESKQIASSMKMIFNLLWNQGERSKKDAKR
ncbi:MAG: helix-turn-helix domain-containing protein [Patescibacteria group bacterium]